MFRRVKGRKYDEHICLRDEFESRKCIEFEIVRGLNILLPPMSRDINPPISKIKNKTVNQANK